MSYQGVLVLNRPGFTVMPTPLLWLYTFRDPDRPDPLSLLSPYFVLVSQLLPLPFSTPTFTSNLGPSLPRTCGLLFQNEFFLGFRKAPINFPVSSRLRVVSRER